MSEILDRYHVADQWRNLGFQLGHLGDPAPVKQDLDEVFDSLLAILNTRRGERLDLPEFGSDLHGILFEPNDQFTQQEARSEIIRAINVWEPRLEIDAIFFQATPFDINQGMLFVTITAHLLNNPRVSSQFRIPIAF